jgi:very-short-patch-repair endonuclease
MPVSQLLPRARSLRSEQTRAEAKLWRVLSNRQLGGWKWKRQVPRGRYIVDFYCAEARLVVELDGGQHAGQVAYDAWRTLELEEAGLRIIRFWNNEIFENLRGVCDVILTACGGEHPNLKTKPLPALRGAVR